MKEQVRKLWQLCFNDSEAFIDLYFRLRYSNDVNIAISSGDEVIAALQLLSYPMTCDGEVVPTAYVSGACTHPDYRNRGVMRELLSQAFARMDRSGVVLSTLIPAEPWLFDYYARSGYASLFHTACTPFTDAGGTLPADAPAFVRSCDYRPEEYAYLNRKLRERDCCIQHTKEDYRVLLADLQLGGGFIGTLRRGSNVLALAFLYPDEDGGWQVGEVVADAPVWREWLLRCVCRHVRQTTIQVLSPVDETARTAVRPLGMMRIIKVHQLLRLYAAAHPEVDINIALTDEQLSANSGYYYMTGGKCTFSTEPLLGSHRQFTPATLAEWLFAGRHPYMSLMMN